MNKRREIYTYNCVTTLNFLADLNVLRYSRYVVRVCALKHDNPFWVTCKIVQPFFQRTSSRYSFLTIPADGDLKEFEFLVLKWFHQCVRWHYFNLVPKPMSSETIVSFFAWTATVITFQSASSFALTSTPASMINCWNIPSQIFSKANASKNPFRKIDLLLRNNAERLMSHFEEFPTILLEKNANSALRLGWEWRWEVVLVSPCRVANCTPGLGGERAFDS